jgi:hypothetical protein
MIIRKFTVMLFLVAIVLGQIGCDKVKTIEKLEKVLLELRADNRDIAKITNDQFEAGKLDVAVLAAVIPACNKFSQALDAGDAAIVAAKLVTEAGEQKSALDYAERIINGKVFDAFTDVVAAVINVPPELRGKIDALLSEIRAAFALLRLIIGDAQIAIGGRERYV